MMLPSAKDVLFELDQAGGQLPQSAFDTDYNDACDFLFLNGFIDCDPETVSLSAKGINEVKRLKDLT